MTGRPDGAPAGDPLDRIEEAARDYERWGRDVGLFRPESVLALVAVARAARDIPPEILAMLPKVRKALARLDGAR